MFWKIKNTLNKVKDFLIAWAVSASTMAITYSWWLVTFESADNVVVDKWVSNALSNFWAWLTFVLPYLWVFGGVLLIVAIWIRLSSRFGR